MSANDQQDVLRTLYTSLEDVPMPISIFAPDGTLVGLNRATEHMWGSNRLDSIGRFNVLNDPQIQAMGIAETFERVMQGEVVASPPTFFDFPLYDDTGAVRHIAVLTRDITHEMEQSQTTEAAREELEQQRLTIMELSSPVVKVWEGILTMPLIGVIDARRATAITENLLETIVLHQADSVIIDITGVSTVDTQVANYLLSAARACRLLGSQVALVGIGSEVAQTIVHLGVDLSDLVTRSDLQAGIAWALERQGYAVTAIAG